MVKKNRKKICVFCGSSSGKNLFYQKTVKKVGKIIGELNYDLVFGGGKTGLMGLLSKSAHLSGANIQGVIPSFLTKIETPMNNIELTVTNTMSVRKAKMYKMSNLFLILNGGIGTLDECIEVLTLVQLKQIYKKPVLILNIDGFWEPIFEMFNKMIEEGFLKEEHLKNFTVLKNIKELKTFLKSF